MIKCGFFNSLNDDRTYYAEDMNEPYKGLVSNGVLVPNADATEAEKLANRSLKVSSNGGMNIKVGSGRGIFDNKWFINDADITLTINSNNTLNPRIDSVIVRIDNRNSGRNASIIVIEGTPASSPVPPAINTITNAVDYRLANIRVNAGAVLLTNSVITDTRGGSDCGWCAGLIKQIDTSELFTQFQAGFDEWFSDVKETLATSTLIRSYEHVYTTTNQDETEIPIGISQYNQNLDILQVYINGLMLVKNLEYVVDSNSQITLTNGVKSGTPINFVVYKSIDGSDAESVVSQVNALQNLVNASIITSSTGSTKVNVNAGEDPLAKFVNAGIGFHTLYIQSGALNVPSEGAYRGVGHLTGTTAGWLMIFQASGSVYVNYYNGEVWRGWRVVHESTPQALYYSATGAFPNPNLVITPSKPLNMCQHGWQLVFNLYNNGSLNNCVQTFCIPKRSNNNANWNNENIIIPLMFQTNDGFENTFKLFSVTNESLVSSAYNSAGSSRNIVLRAIYEY